MAHNLISGRCWQCQKQALPVVRTASGDWFCKDCLYTAVCEDRIATDSHSCSDCGDPIEGSSYCSYCYERQYESGSEDSTSMSCHNCGSDYGTLLCEDCVEHAACDECGDLADYFQCGEHNLPRCTECDESFQPTACDDCRNKKEANTVSVSDDGRSFEVDDIIVSWG